MFTKIKVMRLFGALLLMLAVTPWLGVSLASADQPAPASGDSRATVHEGNATTCAQAGLSGSIITTHVTSTNDGTNIDISAVDVGYKDSGIVVKGGDNYNVYVPGQLGLGAVPP